jgi:hypothetical protein
MAERVSPEPTVPHCLEGDKSSNFFCPVPEYIGSLLPAIRASDVEEVGAAGTGIDDVAREEGWSHEGCGGDELGCSMDELMVRDLGTSIDGAAAPCATSIGIQEGTGGYDDAGIGNSSSKAKK